MKYIVDVIIDIICLNAQCLRHGCDLICNKTKFVIKYNTKCCSSRPINDLANIKRA